MEMIIEFHIFSAAETAGTKPKLKPVAKVVMRRAKDG